MKFIVDEPKDFDTLEGKVIEWARERGILDSSDPKSQMLKCVAEVGELADAINESDSKEVIDGIGDVLVTLILTNELFSVYYLEKMSLTVCLREAYEEIKDRKGKMVNGVFVKE